MSSKPDSFPGVDQVNQMIASKKCFNFGPLQQRIYCGGDEAVAFLTYNLGTNCTGPIIKSFPQWDAAEPYYVMRRECVPSLMKDYYMIADIDKTEQYEVEQLKKEYLEELAREQVKLQYELGEFARLKEEQIAKEQAAQAALDEQLQKEQEELERL